MSLKRTQRLFGLDYVTVFQPLRGAIASRRKFSTSQATRAHGVFAGIASSRMTTPWIDAYNHQHEKGVAQSVPTRDLSPKKMSDSYHKMVCLDKSLNRAVC